ncbi:MAG: hypothetical protein ABSC73_08830 [Acidimicrobiales bacterium]
MVLGGIVRTPLRRASDRFSRAWKHQEVAVHRPDRKTIDHPEVGKLTVDCDVAVEGSEVRIVVHTADPAAEMAKVFPGTPLDAELSALSADRTSKPEGDQAHSCPPRVARNRDLHWCGGGGASPTC